MERVFLSCSFRPDDALLRKHVTQMIDSHLLRAVEGAQLDGRQLTSALMDEIKDCDALVAIVAWRDPAANAGMLTSQYVLDELQHARTLGRPTLALWDDRVPVQGIGAAYERATFTQGDTVEALIKLSNSLGKWRDRSGHSLRALLLPQEVVRHARRPDFVCEYRFTRDGNPTDWRTAGVSTETGGTIAFLRTPNLRDNVELRVSVGDKKWYSPAYPQQVQIQLEE